MPVATKTRRSKIINQVIRLTKSRMTPKQLPLVSTFIKQYFSNVPIEDLESRDYKDLYHAAASHWDFLYVRKPSQECKIHAFNPTLEKDGWSSPYTIIEVITLDMPFLVDTIRMHLNRLGCSSHLVIHLGGMQVKRDKKGQITEVLPFGSHAKNVLVEAPIYIEVDRQAENKKLDEIESVLSDALTDVRRSVEDWSEMREKVMETIDELKKSVPPLNSVETDEVIAFLHRLVLDHFVFIGYREYDLTTKDKKHYLKIVKDSGLGVLRQEANIQGARDLADFPHAARERALSNEILIISKTNTKSTIHRSAYTDYIGVKRFDKEGNVVGERRFIGLYTSDAYNSNPEDIPFFRIKVKDILNRTGVVHHGHAAKAIVNIIETLPRDDFFQGDVDELAEMVLGIWHLQERRRIRLFARRDAYNRYMSCLVYLPREKFNTDLLQKMQDVLMKAFHGVEVTYTTYFPESVLARINFVIRTDPLKRLRYDVKKLEQKLVEVGRSWSDMLVNELFERYGTERGGELAARYQSAFPVAYREVFKIPSALYDIEKIESLNAGRELAMSLYKPATAEDGIYRFKLYRYDQTVPLSDALPMLEHMGLRVIGEQPFEIKIQDRSVWINDFIMIYTGEIPFSVEDIKITFQNAFYRIWQEYTGNDDFNRLVLASHLTWREIRILRCYAKYLRQAGFPFSQQYVQETFFKNPKMSVLLVKLYLSRFDPKLSDSERTKKSKHYTKALHEGLDKISSLDEDRIFRRYVAVIQATLRTNYFQVDQHGNFKPYLAIKLDPHQVPDLPLPLPKFEAFVYSARFEGIHLRGAAVARGGLRWSDRREDFRTEVLGLMKAQQVKNAVIVPYGAKGGFVTKRLPIDGSREEIQQEGIYCYQQFISGLLDLVDNHQNARVVRPSNTIAYDDDDTYLVVAADKGTATFSDIANKISLRNQFWLGDAFASGGSAGYDHKKMGITARGAWESVKCHFLEIGVNTQTDDITVVGIGDMSGDVFGNGMLLSEHIQLVAAFNHMHIFIDPNPDPKVSFEERKRLFKMHRSSWSDYNPELISSGGGIYLRSSKAIKLSPEAKSLLDINKDSIVPNELIRAILRAKVDLLWNGGIGTYVKSTHETNDDVGDRTNDHVRINGKELGAKVVGEGGNLGLTQLARIEYDLHGGLINTDFIDNSGGVDCSDHEVNIKILLGHVMTDQSMTIEERNKLLSKMTKDVTDNVLYNNYRQARAVSYAVAKSSEYLDLYRQYLDHMERENKIPRTLEYLPDDVTLLERKRQEQGLTRPEIAVLMAYSKIILKQAILASRLVDDPFLKFYAKSGFPKILREKYTDELEHHQLKKEIIATQLSNDIVTNMGVTFIYQLHDETAESIETVIRAYVVARNIFNLRKIRQEIESLDYKVSHDIQAEMMKSLIQLVRRATRWFLRNRRNPFDIGEIMTHFVQQLSRLEKVLPKLLAGSDLKHFKDTYQTFTDAGVSTSLAQKVSMSRAMYSIINIVEVATELNVDTLEVAKVYYNLMDRLDLIWFREQINAYPITDHWSVLARAAYKGDLDLLQRKLTANVMMETASSKNIDERIDHWIEARRKISERWLAMVSDLRDATTSEFSMLTVAMRELTELANSTVTSVVESS